MLIQIFQKWWIENSSLLTCVKTIQNSAYGVVLYCFYMREIGLDFSIQHYWSHYITTIFVGMRIAGPNRRGFGVWTNIKGKLIYYRPTWQIIAKVLGKGRESISVKGRRGMPLANIRPIVKIKWAVSFLSPWKMMLSCRLSAQCVQEHGMLQHSIAIIHRYICSFHWSSR